MASLRPVPLPSPGDTPDTGGGLAPVPVPSGTFPTADPGDITANLTPWRGRSTHYLAHTQNLRATVRPYDELPENTGDVVLLAEANRDNQIGQQVAQPSFLIPGPARLEPTTFRGE